MTDANPDSGAVPPVRRRAVLDRRYRNALLVGLGIAVLVHVSILASNPGVETQDLEAAASLGVDVSLPPPSEVSVDGRPLGAGSEWPVLLSNYAAVREALTRTWPRAYQRVGEGGSASLRLVLDSNGVVTSVELAEGTDDRSKDRAFLALARDFRFSLQLDGQTPERVEILQPVRVSPRQ